MKQIVVKVEESNETTLQAMEEAKAGKTIKCSSFEEYLKTVQSL